MSDLAKTIENNFYWESKNDWLSPQNIASGENSQEEELEITYEKVIEEIEEGIEVARAVENLEKGKKVEHNEHFDYTNDLIDDTDRVYEDDDLQLRDELGYELADLGIFAIKTLTCVEENIDGTESYLPGSRTLADTIENYETSKTERSYAEALEKIEKTNKTEISKDGEIDGEAVVNAAEETLQMISGIAGELEAETGRSISDYIAEKMQYNMAHREEEDIGSEGYDKT